jgi:hypothetical protein
MSTAGTTHSGASFATPPGPPPRANAAGAPPNANVAEPPPNANVAGPPPNANIFPLLVANPPLPVHVVYTYNDITDLNDKPWDLLTRADQACWLVASSADSNHKRINISVNTALLLIDLFKDKAFFLGWEQLISVPISGNSLFGPASATLSNVEPIMSVNITAQSNVLWQWMSISLLACRCG